MANCINYNCDPLGTHTIDNSCKGIVKGGVQNLILLDCNHQMTNPSSAAQLNSEINANRAKIITNVRCGFNKPSPITVESLVSCGVPRPVNYDRVGTIKDGNISSTNIDFWNSLVSGRWLGGMVLLECYDAGDKPYVTWINAQVFCEGGRVVPDVNTGVQLFDMEFKWRSLRDAQRYDAPVGVTDGSQTFN